MGSNSKGDRGEREFVRLMDDLGWTVMRAPASGSATKRELPDVLMGRDGRFISVELKSTSKEVVYVSEDEVVALREFAKAWGGDARLCFRFDEEHGDPTYGTDMTGFYIFEPSDLYRTDGGNYRCKKSKAIEDGLLYAEL